MQDLKGNMIIIYPPSQPKAFKKEIKKILPFFWQKSDPLLILMRILGIHPCIQNSAGYFEFKWISVTTFYSIILHLSLSVLQIFALKEQIPALLKVTEVDDLIFFGVFTAGRFLQLLPFCILIEAKKTAAFLNDLTHFQNEYNKIAKRDLPRKSNIKIHWLCLILGFIFCGFLIVRCKNDLNVLFEKYNLHLTTALFSAVFSAVEYGYVGLLLLKWNNLNKYVRHCTIFLIEEVESCHWVKSGSLNNYLIAWEKLHGLVEQLGDIYWITFAVGSILIFSSVLPTLYGAVFDPRSGSLYKYGGAIWLLLILTLFIEFSHNTVNQVQGDFKKRIRKLFYNNKIQGNEEALRQFYRDITYEEIYFGGFIAMNRTSILAIYSSVVTYFVILIQFSDPTSKTSNNSSLTSPCNPC